MKKQIISKDLKKMNKEQLIELLNKTELEKDAIIQSNSFNEITLGDVSVKSTEASLKKCKGILNAVIKKHEKFLTARKKKLNAEEQGYLG